MPLLQREHRFLIKPHNKRSIDRFVGTQRFFERFARFIISRVRFRNPGYIPDLRAGVSVLLYHHNGVATALKMSHLSMLLILDGNSEIGAHVSGAISVISSV